MKKTLLILMTITSFWSIHGQTQTSSSKEIGVMSTVSIYDHTYRGSINPHISFKKGKKSWSFGPLLLVASSIGSNVTSIPKFTGLKVAYRFYPAVESKRLDYYLTAEFLAQRIKDTWQANSFDSNLGKFSNFKYQNVELIFENYVGYGIRFKNWQEVVLIKQCWGGILYLQSKWK